MGTMRMLLAAVALVFATAARAGDVILVQVPAVFDPQAAVSDAVRRECGIDVLLGNDVFARVKARFPDSAPVQKSSAGADEKVLNLTILTVNAAGGGAWSGRKGVAVRADLVQSGKIVATTVKERSSGGGAFGGFKGTCAILDRVTAALAADITAWLAQTALSSNGKTGPATATESQKQPEGESTAGSGKTD
jgi:hypothetical protein